MVIADSLSKNEDQPLIDTPAPTLKSTIVQKIANRQSIFTPFASFWDGLHITLSPVLWPIVTGIASLIAAAVIIPAAVASVVSLFFAAGAILLKNHPVQNTAFTIAAVSAIIMASAILVSFVSALLTPFMPFIGLGFLVGRSAASIDSSIKNCSSESSNQSLTPQV